jgi:hypothetical protein
MYDINRLLIVSLTPRHCRNAPTAPIQMPPASIPATAIKGVATSHGVPAGKHCGTTAAARPPSASAPSPPITISPTCAGKATHSAVNISGDARSKVLCHANDEPNAP